MWLGGKIRKHINSLLILSIWVLSISLYFLLLYLPEYHEDIRNSLVYIISLHIVEFIGISALMLWTIFLTLGVSRRVLKLYKKTKFAIEEIAYLFIFIIFFLIGYLYGQSDLTIQLAEKNAQLQKATMKIASLEVQLKNAAVSPNPPPISSPTPTPKKLSEIIPTVLPGEWGVAKQLSEHTWTMKIGMDSKMATPQELFERLNTYRYIHSRGSLRWDDRLAKYAQSRTQTFTSIGKTDGHAGFIDYVHNEENVRKLGFWSVGENSSYGYKLEAIHIIEWVYAGDKPHNDNQLNSRWTHVGIGVDGTQTDFIFGSDEIR